MADKEVNLKVSVDTGNAVKTLGDLDSALKETSKDVKALGKDASLSDRLKELNKTVKDSPVSIRAMNKQIQEYQAIALEAGRTSPIGKAALQEAANMKDRYNDINAEVNRLANDGIKMQAALDLGTSIVGGYAAFQGAMALTGVESEELQKTLVKLQGAQSVLMGIETIRKNLEKESTLVIQGKIAAEKAKLVIDKLSLNSLRQNIAGLFGKTAATTADTAATAGATTATTFFGAALNLLPIAAIITGITLLIVFFDDVKKAIMSVANSIYESFKPSIDVVVDALQWLGLVESDEEKARAARQSEAVAKQKKIAAEKLALINAEIEANKKLTEEVTSALDFEIAKRQAAGQDTAGLERSKLEVLIKSTKKEIELSELKNEARIKEIKIISKMGGVVSQVAKDRLKEIEEEQLGLVKNLESLNQQLEIFDIKQAKIKSDNIKKSSDERKKVNDKAAEEDKKAADKKAEDDKKAAEDALKEKQRLADEEFKLKLELINKEEKATEDYRVRQLSEEQKALEDLSNRYFEEQEAFKNNEEMLLILKAEYEAEKLKVESEFSEKRREEKAAAFKQDVDNAANLIGSLTALNNAALEAQLAGAEGNEAKQNEIRKRAFARDKALQLAMATVNGVQAVLSTFAGTPGGLVIKSIAAGLAGATALANITKIARTKFEGSGGGSVPSSLGNTASGAGGADVRPVTNTTTTTGESTKVYVTEQDISNTQNKVSVNEAQATI